MDEKAQFFPDWRPGVDFGGYESSLDFRKFSAFFRALIGWTRDAGASSARNATSPARPAVRLLGGSHRLFPLSRGPRRRRATLFWSPTLASTDRLRWPPSRVISSPPARRRPPSRGRRAARARPSACPPPGRPPPSPSALAAARRSPPPRCVHRATTRADRDPRLLAPARIARRLPTRVVLPNSPFPRLRRARPPRSPRVPAGRDRGRSDPPVPPRDPLHRLSSSPSSPSSTRRPSPSSPPPSSASAPVSASPSSSSPRFAPRG